MTEDTPENPPETTPAPASAVPAEGKSGNRIAKVLARAGLASRRDAEKLIAAGRIAVNGRVIDSPALDVGPKDRVTLDGQPIPDAEPPRLWLYHKPPGLVTTEKDEEGRATVFDNLPDDLPRVMSVGRLDITSEGLLLLTNDGEIKRRLELPSTGWLRKYRVRVNGTPDDASLAPLRQGITVDGVAYQPMQVTLDRQQGANAWLTVGLREGKNREVRRAMEAVGLTVNRLIRVSYGPFRLEEIEPGQVVEVRPKVVRDQLGLAAPDPAPSGRAVRTVRASGPRPASVKGAFAPKEGKAGWLANPSSSGRPKAGGKAGGGARRSLDAAPEAGPNERTSGSKSESGKRPFRSAGAGFGSKSAAGAGRPKAAGSRSAVPAGTGYAPRPKPAWRDRASEDDGASGTGSDVRVRKPRAPKGGPSDGPRARPERSTQDGRSGEGRSTYKRGAGEPGAEGGARPSRGPYKGPARGQGGSKDGGSGRFGASAGPAKPAYGARGPKPAGRSSSDTDERPGGTGPRRERAAGFSDAPKARGPRRDDGPAASGRPERGPRKAGGSTGTGYKGGAAGSGARSPDSKGPGTRGAGGKGPRPAGSGPKGAGPRAEGSGGPGSRGPGGAGGRSGGPRSDGPRSSGPRGAGGGPKPQGGKPRGPKPR